MLVIIISLVTGALLTEAAFERRDAARYTKGETFASVGEARIRYKLLGADKPGALVVLLTGLGGSVEQFDEFQRAISTAAPALTYDRAGYGFSERSRAHSAEEQAIELAGLLRAINFEKPVVLVAYSLSAPLARVFMSRFPEKTAGIYLIEPTMPELDDRIVNRHSPRRRYWRVITSQLLYSSLGMIRATQRWTSREGPASLVERRAEAVLARRAHYWALAQEWYAFPASQKQALDATVPPYAPLEIVFTKQEPEDEITRVQRSVYAQFVARSSRGKLIELEHGDHQVLSRPGPLFDQMVERTKELSLSNIVY